MNFESISLSHEELRLLRKSKKASIPKQSCLRLLRLKLVFEERTQSMPGGMPVGTGRCRISDFGVDYLAYHWYQTKKNYFIPVVVSAIVAFITTMITMGITGFAEWLS